MIGRIFHVACLLAVAAGAGSWADAAEGSASGSTPSPLRQYTFESVSPDSPVAKSLGTEAEPLKYTGSDGLTIVEGRSSERKAVRIDNGAFQGKPFVPSERGCTVELWFRKNGQGSQLGNGRTNGMFFCLGSGYWDGMRSIALHTALQ